MKCVLAILVMTGVAGASPVQMDGPATAPRGPAALGAAVVERMQASADRLTGRDPGLETQELQKQAVDALDALIAMAREQPPAPPATQSTSAQAANRQPSPNPGDPTQENGNRNGSGGGGPRAFEAMSMEDLRKNLAEWPVLGKARRTAVINCMQRGALKAYSAKVASYYASLAEMDRADHKR